jgi:myosin heavy subunit
VRHFAGEVRYHVAHFLDKNKDVISSTVVSTCGLATCALVRDFFTEPPPPEDDAAADSKKKKGRSGRAKAQKTIGAQFKTQLNGLMKALSETQAHFVRCIKPNQAKLPDRFDAPLTLQQLK